MPLWSTTAELIICEEKQQDIYVLLNKAAVAQMRLSIRLTLRSQHIYTSTGIIGLFLLFLIIATSL
jgi:hypothetical protein